MKKKTMVTGVLLSAVLLVGCKDGNADTLIDGVKNDEVVLKVNDEIEITGKDLKEQIDTNQLSMLIENLIYKNLIISKYPVSEKELEEKAIEMALKYDELSGKELIDVKYNAAYEKGLFTEFKPNQEQMQAVYDSFYAQSGATMKDVEKDVFDMATRIAGAELFDQIINEEVKSAKIQFSDEELEKVFNHIE